MSDKINNSEIDCSDNQLIEQVTPVELTSHAEPVEQVAPVELTSHAEQVEQVAPVELTSHAEPFEQVAAVELTSNTEHIKINDIESIEITELIKPIIEEVAINTEPIKITIDVEPTEIILIPNNIEHNNISIISGSDDVIKTIKTNLIVLEQESKQEKLVSSIELEEVNNKKMQCCFFFQYPKWRK